MFTSKTSYPTPPPYIYSQTAYAGSGTLGVVVPLVTGLAPIPLAAGRLLLVKYRQTVFSTAYSGQNNMTYSEGTIIVIGGATPVVDVSNPTSSNSPSNPFVSQGPLAAINGAGDLFIECDYSDGGPADIHFEITELTLYATT